MNEGLLLLRLHLKSIRNCLVNRDHILIWRSVFALILAVAFWLGTFFFFSEIFNYLYTLPVYGAILANRLLSAVFLIFFFLMILSNIIIGLSVFYASPELELLISMPLKIDSIFMDKFVHTFIYSSWVVFCFGLPLFIAYQRINGEPFSSLLLMLCLVTPFFIIPFGVAIALTVIIGRLFSAKRVRSLTIVFIAIFMGMGFLLFFFMRPQIMANPESIGAFDEYLYNLKLAVSPYLPNYWIAEGFASIVNGKLSDAFFYFLLLLSCAGSTIILCFWLAHSIYYKGWTKSQEGGGDGGKIGRYHLVPAIVGRIVPFLGRAEKALVIKDIKTFLRDPFQGADLLFLLSLVVIYLANVRHLPFNIELPFWKTLLCFVNITLVTYIMAIICIKLAFPAVSLEGKKFWLIGSSPLGRSRFLYEKFYLLFFCILILGGTLVVISNIILGVSYPVILFTLLVFITLMGGLSAISVGLGAVFPRFDLETGAEISSGFGGFLTMVISVVYMGAVIFLEGWLVYIDFPTALKGGGLMRLQICSVLLLLILINVAARWLPMKFGIRVFLREDL